MELFHGSHSEISSISDTGLFGGISAAASREAAASHGDHLYRINSPRPLSNYALNYEINNAWEVAVEVAGGDEDIAEAIMTAECSALEDAEDAGEQGWEFQRLRGVLAGKLGFTSVEMRDEHGTTYLCLSGCTIERIA
ncbi:TPA: hypothetical protein ACGXSN_001176 [Pseudomonas aeruginosa]